MGCSTSTAYDNNSANKGMKKRRSTASVTSLDALVTEDQAAVVKTRFGHPSLFSEDGYNIGLRVRVKGLQQSFFVGCSRKSNEKVTIKEHHLKNSDDDDQSQCVVNEIMILTELSHPAIPHLEEVFITDFSAYMIMEYLDPYRLLNFIDWQAGMSRLSLDDARFIFKTLASAVHHCHEEDILVRDLSPMNILVKKNFPTVAPPSPTLSSSSSSNKFSSVRPSTNTVLVPATTPFDVKIVDFSFAVREGHTESMRNHPLFDASMTPYCAPEVFSHGNRETKAMDMWSLGVLYYVMIAGHLPWSQSTNIPNDPVLLGSIQSGKVSFVEDCWKDAKDEKTIISQLLDIHVNKRMTANELMKVMGMNL